MRFSKTLLVFGLLLISVGCQTLAKRNNTGVVVARRAQIRSSTAVVAADLLQVNRGDVVDILDSTDVTDPSDNTRKERWLRVKARDTISLKAGSSRATSCLTTCLRSRKS